MASADTRDSDIISDRGLYEDVVVVRMLEIRAPPSQLSEKPRHGVLNIELYYLPHVSSE